MKFHQRPPSLVSPPLVHCVALTLMVVPFDHKLPYRAASHADRTCWESSVGRLGECTRTPAQHMAKDPAILSGYNCRVSFYMSIRQNRKMAPSSRNRTFECDRSVRANEGK